MLSPLLQMTIGKNYLLSKFLFFFQRILLALEESQGFVLVTEMLCFKMAFQATWPYSVIAQLFVTYNAPWYKLTIDYCISKTILQIIFIILPFFTLIFVNVTGLSTICKPKICKLCNFAGRKINFICNSSLFKNIETLHKIVCAYFILNICSLCTLATG